MLAHRTMLLPHQWAGAGQPLFLPASAWPHLLAEPAYPGVVSLDPREDPPSSEDRLGDGSLGARSGTAAFQASSNRCLLLVIDAQRSSNPLRARRPGPSLTLRLFVAPGADRLTHVAPPYRLLAPTALGGDSRLCGTPGSSLLPGRLVWSPLTPSSRKGAGP